RHDLARRRNQLGLRAEFLLRLRAARHHWHPYLRPPHRRQSARARARPDRLEINGGGGKYIVEHRDELPEYFVDALTLTPDDHLRVLKSFQDHVDNSISKTVNAPASYSVEDTDRVHRLAWKLGVKAVSYYRDGSRD